MPDASQMIRVTRMVQRITQAPPPRLTYSCLRRGYERPIFPLRFELFTFEPLAFAPTALGSFLLAPALLTLPFAAPAFRGLAASGSAIDATTTVASTDWVGLGGTGNSSCRTCAGSSLVKAMPSSRSPAPDGSVVTTPSGSPSSFQASAASSSSSLSLSSPAMIASAIKPAFWRTAVSILLAMSGFSLRNCLAFSRPWPMRWLS